LCAGLICGAATPPPPPTPSPSPSPSPINSSATCTSPTSPSPSFPLQFRRIRGTGLALAERSGYPYFNAQGKYTVKTYRLAYTFDNFMHAGARCATPPFAPFLSCSRYYGVRYPYPFHSYLPSTVYGLHQCVPTATLNSPRPRPTVILSAFHGVHYCGEWPHEPVQAQQRSVG